MKLSYAAPPAEMTPYLSAYYLFESDAEELTDIERADIAQVRYFLNGSGSVRFADDSGFASVPVTVLGPRMKASQITIRGPLRVFGYGLLPAGWAAVTRLPADKYANGMIDAQDLFGPVVMEFHKRLQGMATIEEMAALMNEEFAKFWAEATKVQHWFIRAVDDWLETKLSPDIADLEASTGLSRRQIERLAKQYFGAPPKMLVRKYRALRTANAIARGQGDWQDFIDEAYYDQSHFIREVKEFIGITPSAVRDHVSPLTTMTWDRSMLMGQIAPLSAVT